MGLPAEKPGFTAAEYLRKERSAIDRHEFHDGEILAMSGGTYNHSAIAANFLMSLGRKIKEKRCRPLDSNMRVRIANRNAYVYPDVSMVCGPPQFDVLDEKQTTIINPTLIAEILSESTESYDRGGKFKLYQQIPSLMEYLLISQSEPLVETFVREDGNAWLFNTWSGLEASLKLKSLKLSLPLSEIFSGITFAA